MRDHAQHEHLGDLQRYVDDVRAESGVTGRYARAFGTLTVAAGTDPGTLTISTVPRDDVAWQPPADPDVTVGFVDATTVVGRDLTTRPIGTFGPLVDGRSAWLNWHHRMAPRVD